MVAQDCDVSFDLTIMIGWFLTAPEYVATSGCFRGITLELANESLIHDSVLLLSDNATKSLTFLSFTFIGHELFYFPRAFFGPKTGA